MEMDYAHFGDTAHLKERFFRNIAGGKPFPAKPKEVQDLIDHFIDKVRSTQAHLVADLESQYDIVKHGLKRVQDYIDGKFKMDKLDAELYLEGLWAHIETIFAKAREMDEEALYA